jgi:hypothetical protein
MARALVAAAAAAIGVLAEAPEGTAAAQASRIVDRTVVCQMTGIGYPDSLRYMTVSAAPYDAGDNRSPVISASNGSFGYPGAGVGLRTGPAGRENETPTGSLGMTRTQTGRCTNSRLRIKLSSRGLEGGPTGPDRKWYRCDVPAKVVIRVRAVFKRPTFFRVDPRFPDSEEANGDIETAHIAVVTVRGRRPVAFISAHHATGSARIFIAPSRCEKQL